MRLACAVDLKAPRWLAVDRHGCGTLVAVLRIENGPARAIEVEHRGMGDKDGEARE